MHKMMFGYKIKAMHKGCVRECVRLCLGKKSKLCIRDASAMCKGMRKMMFGYKIKAVHKGCISYP